MVERRRRTPVTTFFHDGPLGAGTTVALPESAAHHARVKRMDVGDSVRLTDGAGTVAEGAIVRIARAAVDVQLQRVGNVDALAPLELYAPVGDRDRMLWLAEKATELGATAWRPVRFHRSRSVATRGEGDGFAAKVRARMINALEQSGGAWMPAMHAESDVTTAAACAAACAGTQARYLLDASGGRFDASGATRGAAVILGPEGGIEPDERAVLVGAGWRPVSLGPTVLRFETAGIAAMALVRASQVTPGG